MLLNVAYQHLHARLRHGQKCTADRCGDGCGFAGFDRWLQAPVLASEAAAEQRRAERLKVLLRGEIPA